MPLAPNSRLGPYEIKSALGAGGMGEVYRAHDSRLHRDVAIKILAGDAAATVDLKTRFEREARAVAALNHPNIVGVFDFGAEGSTQYIVSELVDGESLRQAIGGKPVPIRRLIEIATQIADGLAAAHAADIVHRDLKPENIMLAKDGRVKILDFGLARQRIKPPAAIKSSDETLIPPDNPNQHLTSAGSILGTANYMSPEQAVGKETDYRSDQFSFGLILHEMASGKQAFARASSVETMAAIVRDEPPPIEEKLPAPLKWIIDRCLHKEPQQRYDSTRDLYQELRNLRDHLSEAYSTSGPITAVPVKTHPGRWTLPAALAIAGLAIGALLTWLLNPPAQDLSQYHYTPFASDAFSAAWSPDGKAVAYLGDQQVGCDVYVRYLNAQAPTRVFHSTAIFAQLAGWSSDRSHLILAEYSGTPTVKILSIPVLGGDAEPVLEIPAHRATSVLGLSPDGKTLAILIRGEDQKFHLMISDPIGSPPHKYLPEPFTSSQIFGRPQIAFSPDQKSIFISRSGDNDHPEMWLVPYPAGTGKIRRVFTALGSDYTPHISWMEDNRHGIISLNQHQVPDQLFIADVFSGRTEPLTIGPHIEREPALSPDQKSLIYLEYSHTFDLVSISVADGTVTRFETGAHSEHKGTWASRAQRFAWVSERSGLPEIWLRSADGSERPVVTQQEFPPGMTRFFTNPSLSPDGERLVYGRIDANGHIQQWISLLSGGAPVRLTNNPLETVEYPASWSPDGTQCVFIQNQSGQNSLARVKTSGNATPVIIRKDVSHVPIPAWSPTGEWITFEGSDTNDGLISPDGKTSKSLGNFGSDGIVFSSDGRQLYGIRGSANSPELFRVDVATLKAMPIKKLDSEWMPTDDLRPGVRFSLAPDGKSFVYPILKGHYDLWMLTGFRQPGWTDRIRSWFAHAPS